MAMLSTIRNQIAERGYTFIPGHSPGLKTTTIALAFGRPVTPLSERLVQQLIPRASAAPNTYSGIYGLDSFPFHTDLAHWRRPPRYLLLRCVKGYSEVSTLLIDGHAVIAGVTLDIMTRAIVKPRRPRCGMLPLLRLCEQVDDGYLCRWDEVLLKPASRIGGTASQRIRAFLSTADAITMGMTNAGDTLLIDNWRMLHARTAIPAGQEDRIIERVFLERLN